MILCLTGRVIDQAALQNQVMTGGLSRYVPFHISGMMGATPYWFRSGINGGGISFCEDVRPETYPKDLLMQGIAEAKRIRNYYFGNFHLLTEITTSTSTWCVMYTPPQSLDKNLDGDVTGDGYVDMVDLMLLVSKWLQCSDPANTNCNPGDNPV